MGAFRAAWLLAGLLLFSAVATADSTSARLTVSATVTPSCRIASSSSTIPLSMACGSQAMTAVAVTVGNAPARIHPVRDGRASVSIDSAPAPGAGESPDPLVVKVDF